ncbi:hypothetical protein KR215_005758, partial [Drosophila sulfurigaster]
QACDSKTVYKFTNVQCDVPTEVAVNLTCSIKAVNWNKATAEMDAYLLRPIDNISVHFELFKKDYANQYKKFLINIRFNLCDVISKRDTLIYGTIAWKLLKRFSNVNHSCPLDGHLFARNLYMDESYVPIFPLGFYQLRINFTEYLNNRIDTLGVVSLFVQAMEEYRLKSKKDNKTN